MTRIAAFALVALITGAHCLSADAQPPSQNSPAPPEAFSVVQIEIFAPATNYGIKILEIRNVGEELWVLSKVETYGDLGGAAITEISDSVRIAKTDLPQKHFVAGKSWGWADPETVTYLAGDTITDEKWKTGTVVWKMPSKKG